MPANLSRAQDYEAELTLRAPDLSATTKRALRLTRSFGGYVRSVDYGTGSSTGRADLVVRIPVARIQEAIERFSRLGRILGQHVSIRDLQPQIDRRFRRMQTLRHRITGLQAQLAKPGLSSPEKARLERELARTRAELVALRGEQAREKRGASFATVAIGLRTKAAAVALPSRPGRLERALDRAGEILLGELTVLVYVLLVGGPFVLLAALGWGSARAARRRANARLLS